MPNHVHELFTLCDGESLPDTLQGWKGIFKPSHPLYRPQRPESLLAAR